MKQSEQKLSGEYKSWLRIMRRLGIIGATHSEIADQVIRRLDGCEQIIDSLRANKK